MKKCKKVSFFSETNEKRLLFLIYVIRFCVREQVVNEE